MAILPLVFVLACGSAPQPTEPAPSQAPVQQQAPVAQAPAAAGPAPQAPAAAPQAAEPQQEEAFNPGNISEDVYTATMDDIRVIIEQLNRIIRAGNYNEWRGYLSESYIEEISSGAFLEARTEELYRRDQIVAQNLGRNPAQVQKRTLRNARDYFDHIVRPSRQNDRVDEIDFESDTRVKAFTINNQGNSLRLYDLEKIDGKWKIVN